MFSARIAGSIPSSANTSTVNELLRLLRIVLRRWLKASVVMRLNTRSSLTGYGFVLCGTRRTTAESTFGGGVNADGGTSSTGITLQKYCAITLKRPYALLF